MYRALGMVEFKSIAKGINAADIMLKTAKVEVVKACTTCPGKYIILLNGRLSAINAVIQKGLIEYSDYVTDSFILGNPHEQIFFALNRELKYDDVGAMGIIETWSVPSILLAADHAAKAAETNIVKIKMANLLGGKAYVILTGELATVEASINAAIKDNVVKNKLIETSIIPNPDKKLWSSVLE